MFTDQGDADSVLTNTDAPAYATENGQNPSATAAALGSNSTWSCTVACGLTPGL